MKRDPILDDINRLDKHATWSLCLCILGAVLAVIAIGWALAEWLWRS